MTKNSTQFLIRKESIFLLFFVLTEVFSRTFRRILRQEHSLGRKAFCNNHCRQTKSLYIAYMYLCHLHAHNPLNTIQNCTGNTMQCGEGIIALIWNNLSILSIPPLILFALRHFLQAVCSIHRCYLWHPEPVPETAADHLGVPLHFLSHAGAGARSCVAPSKSRTWHFTPFLDWLSVTPILYFQYKYLFILGLH